MPELPDVETYRRNLESTLGRHRFRRVRVIDHQVLDSVTQRKLNVGLRRKQFNEARRHGKYLLARVGPGAYLCDRHQKRSMK